MTRNPSHCVGCGEELCHLDDDPNGDENAICAKCAAEEAHDFDVEPNVVFDRSGRMSCLDSNFTFASGAASTTSTPTVGEMKALVAKFDRMRKEWEEDFKKFGAHHCEICGWQVRVTLPNTLTVCRHLYAAIQRRLKPARESRGIMRPPGELLTGINIELNDEPKRSNG